MDIIKSGNQPEKKFNKMLFEDEECQYINKIVESFQMEHITKPMLLGTLSFARDITDQSNEDALLLIDRVYSRVIGMDDDEWNELKSMLPFPVSITADDNTDEVPADEET